MKEMSKVKIIDKKSEKSILGERDLLSKLKHPFIVNMICAFQDYEYLYLLMDLLTGGDLRFHLNANLTFSEKEIKFFISCIILSLEYIHENNIIHRDIKPENLVSDDKGYIRLTDFGIAKVKKEQNSSDTSGTPGYMAPEVLNAQNHSFTVDFYAIGIIGYEFLIGKRPYTGKNRKEIKQLVFSREAFIEENKNQLWSNNCIDFINRCLKRKVTNRLGYHFGIKELKTHPWFQKYDWLNLYNKKTIAPYIPKKERNYDKKYCESIDKISNSTFERYKGYMRKNDYMKIFEGYTYFNNDLTSNTLENETITRVSTSTKGNKQEVLENQSYGNVYSSVNNENKYYAVTPLKNIGESSMSYNKGNNSVEHKLILLDKKDENKNIENYIFNNSHNNKVNSKTMMKMEQNKRLNKKQISVDILKINKEIREEINCKITDNNNNKENTTKKDSIEFKNDISSNLNLEDNSNININKIKANNINDNFINNNCNISNNVNINEKNNVNKNIINNLNEYNILNKIKKRNISNSSLIEKQIESNNEQFGKNINISLFNFKQFKRKKLNIHNLNSGIQPKESDFEEKNNEHKILPIYLPPINKVNNNSSYNNNNKNNHNLPLLLSNIKQFKFKITKNRKIKHINFNQNKIIENVNKSNDDSQKPFLYYFSKNTQTNHFIRNINNDINNNNYNNINNNDKKSEIYKKLLNNETLKNMKLQLGKSQSTGLFPKIKIS